MARKLELRKRDGVTMIVMNKGKVLLLKRRNVPFITNPGGWAFVSGARKAPESYIATAYRELHEETRLKKADLKLLQDAGKIWMFEPRKPTYKWENEIFVFASKTRNVKLNIENTKFRWASLSELEKYRNYTNVIIDEKKILRIIKRHLNK